MKRQLKISSNSSEDLKEKILKELKLGHLNLSDGMFEQARLNFLVALEYDKTCAEAYWGMMLTKCQISNENALYSYPAIYKDVVLLPEYEKALKFADEELKKVYKSLLENIEMINEGDKY